MLTAKYHPQCEGHVERFNQMNIEELRHCVIKNSREWGLHSLTLNYSYSWQIHWATGCAPYENTLSITPQLITVGLTAQDKQAFTAKEDQHGWLQWVGQFTQEAGRRLPMAKQNYNVNCHRRFLPPRASIEGENFVFCKRNTMVRTIKIKSFYQLPKGLSGQCRQRTQQSL